MFMEPIGNFEQFESSTLTGLVNDGDGPDGAHRRRGVADPDREVRARPLRAPAAPTARNLDRVGSAAHRAVARQAVAESQVLLKNDARDAAAPTAASTVYVAGSNADNIGNQAGGWTLTWQGGSTNVIPGQTDPRRHRGRPPRATSRSARTPRRPVPRNAVGVVVVGETPYAEGFGDVGGPQWGYDPGDNGVPRPPKTMQLSDADTAAIDTVCARPRRAWSWSSPAGR